MIVKDTGTLTPAGGASGPPAGVNPWWKLLIGIPLILFFMFGIGSLAQYIPGARHMAQVIDERNLRVTAIYYTDFEEPAEGSERIRDSLDYTPGGKP
ncbi:MAG: hypothetical protein EHM65_04695 [Acidobacteriales bacterium]|nr:MAG: hypothetical protein EHM65_04695 [Terriglobales bacterium]